MEHKDIRWIQRFSNYRKALETLNRSIDFINRDLQEKEETEMDEEYIEALDDLIKSGLIKHFESLYEMSWNVMKDYLAYQGIVDITTPRASIQEAFKIGLIDNADIWMDMIGSRNRTSHNYSEEMADFIFNKIINEYHPVFNSFENKMEEYLL